MSADSAHCLTLVDSIMPADDICVLIMKLSLAGSVNMVTWVLRHVPHDHRMCHNLKLTVKSVLIVLPDTHTVARPWHNTTAQRHAHSNRCLTVQHKQIIQMTEQSQTPGLTSNLTSGTMRLGWVQGVQQQRHSVQLMRYAVYWCQRHSVQSTPYAVYRCQRYNQVINKRSTLWKFHPIIGNFDQVPILWAEYCSLAN